MAKVITAEHPILMATESVRGILENRKTQTRRLKNLVPVNKTPDHWRVSQTMNLGVWAFFNLDTGERINIKCPFGIVEDTLWIRETWRPVYLTARPRTEKLSVVQYRDGTYSRDNWGGTVLGEKWCASIFMPRIFSRITLEITGIKVERLQDISEEDAKAEGMESMSHAILRAETGSSYPYLVDKYSKLWDSINGKKYPWASNPWCWVIEFRRLETK